MAGHGHCTTCKTADSDAGLHGDDEESIFHKEAVLLGLLK